MKKEIIRKVVENRQHETASYIYKLWSRVDEDGHHYSITKEKKNEEGAEPETVLEDLPEEFWQYLPEATDSPMEDLGDDTETTEPVEYPDIDIRLGWKVLLSKDNNVEFDGYSVTSYIDEEERKVVFVMYCRGGIFIKHKKYDYSYFPTYDFKKASEKELPATEYENFSLLDETGLMMRTHSAIENMGKNFLEISALLYIAKQRLDNGGYVSLNGIRFSSSVTDVYEYGKKNFGFSRGTVSDYINIAKRFLNFIPVEGKEITSVPVPQLNHEYKDYSVSQLQAILPIKDDTWIKENITPNMTVKEIKAAAKQWTAGEEFPTMNTPEIEGKAGNESEGSTEEINPPGTSGSYSTIKEYKLDSFEEYNKLLDNMDSNISSLLKSGKKLVISVAVA